MIAKGKANMANTPIHHHIDMPLLVFVSIQALANPFVTHHGQRLRRAAS